MERIKRHVLGNQILQALRIKSFALMMLSEFLSQVAFNMQHFVLIFIIFGLTHSNTAVSGMILSFMIPAVLFSVISGVYVDRWNKKKVLITAHLVRAALVLPFLIPNLHLGFIYALTFLIAVTTQFYIPAEYSIIPQLVPKKLIVPANAVFSFGIFGIMLIGYVLSGPVLSLLGRTYTISLLIFLFLISSLIVAKIKLAYEKEKPRGEDAPFSKLSIAQEAKEIFVFIRKVSKVMHALLMITIAQSAIFMFAVLGPGYVTTILEAPLESLSLLIIAPAGIGLGVGAFVLGSLNKKTKHAWFSALGFVTVGVVFILMPLASRVTSSEFISSLNYFLPQFLHVSILHLIVLMAFITGFGISLVFIPANSVIQLETSEEMRGRMYGLLSSLTGAVSFLPVILAGGLADIFGVGAVIAIVGIIMTLIGFSYLFLIKH